MENSKELAFSDTRNLKNLISQYQSIATIGSSEASNVRLRESVMSSVTEMFSEPDNYGGDPKLLLSLLKIVNNHEICLIEAKRRYLDTLLKAERILSERSSAADTPVPSPSSNVVNAQELDEEDLAEELDEDPVDGEIPVSGNGKFSLS